MDRLHFGKTTFVLALVMLLPAIVHGQTLTVAWDPSPETDAVSGYEVCIGTSSFSCNIVDALVSGDQTNFAFTPTPGQMQYIAVRAMNPEGQSEFSAEVTISVPSLAEIPNQSGPPGAAIAPLALIASDPDGTDFTMTQTGLPPGLVLDAVNRVIVGTPTTAGVFNTTISVWDGLGGDSQDFTWTIGEGIAPTTPETPSNVPTGGTADVVAPVVVISSHAQGQSVSPGTITVAGTVTDGPTGGSGIVRVRVNGLLATGGTATGSNTASWSSPVTIVAGLTPVITIDALDGAGNVATAQLSLSQTASTSTPEPMTGVSVSMDRPSSQPLGTTVVFTASGSGGVAPYQFRWYVRSGIQAWQLAQDWSSSTSFAWTPAQEGVYMLAVWGRSAGATSDGWQAYAQVAYGISGQAAPAPIAPVSGVTMSSTVSSPQVTGTSVGFSASASGGVAPYEYQWSVQKEGYAAQVVRPWSTAGAFTWTPLEAGNYLLVVAARSAGVTVDAAQASANALFLVTAPPPPAPLPVSAVSVAPNVQSPQSTGTAVTFQATAVGGVAPYQYRWFVQTGGSAPVAVGGWSTTSTLQWVPATAGTYVILVDARSAGVTADSAQASNGLAFLVTAPAPPPPAAPAPVTSVSLVSSKPSPQLTGTAVTWSASAAGGAAPYQYQWYLQSGTGPAQLLRAWSTASTLDWTPAVAASYTVTVWARSAGVTADAAQSLAGATFAVTAPAAPATVKPPIAGQLYRDRPSPQLLGTAVMLLGGAVGGVAPYEYVWFAQLDGQAPVMLKNWDAASYVLWSPTQVGTYRLTVGVRSHGATSATPQVTAELPFVISAPVAPPTPPSTTTPPGTPEKTNNGRGKGKNSTSNLVTDIELSTEVASLFGQTASTTATAAVSAPSSQTLDPNTSGRPNVPSAPAPAPVPPAKLPVSAVTLSPGWSGPLAVGTAATLTAAAQGGTAPYEYQWYVVDGPGAWRVAKTWSASATFQLSPAAAGAYGVGVWARSAGMTAAQAYAEQRFAVVPAVITPMTGAALTFDKPSGQPKGTRVTVAASGTGGVPRYEYRFWVRRGAGTWQPLREWGTDDTAALTLLQPGSYTFAVWARSAGTKADEPQAYAESAYVVK